MRVLHVIPSVAARDGGPAVAVRAMARAVAELDAEVTVVATDADGAGRLDVPLDRPVREEGVDYRYFARSLPGSWKFSWPMTAWLRANVDAYDVVHVHALFSYATIPGCRVAERAGVPYVLRPLGTLDAWSLGQRSWKKRPYLALVERRHLDGAAAVHTTSAAETDAVTRLGYGAKARTIPLGVELPALPVRGAVEGPLRLLFLSRLHPKKGLELLLEALGRIRSEAVLAVAGDGPEEYRAELERLADRLGVRGRITFLGHVEGEAKRAALAGSDAFVLPSYQENFGIAAAEAMAAALPVLLSDQVGLADDVRAAGAGVVFPCDAEALAGAIDRLAADPERARGMGEKGRRLVQDRFSWQRTASSLVSLYEDVIATNRRKGR